MTDDVTAAAAGVLLPGFAGTELPDWLAERLRGGLAGVCLFAENTVDAAQTRALTDAIRAANPRAIIAVDEEGGDVTRLSAASGSPYPGNALLGRIDDLALTARVGAAVARRLAAVGVNLNFAPDVDVNSNPDNPVIGVRSFGAEPGPVARHGAAWIAAHEAEGVATSAKHFPGHGDTAQDSHLALPTVDAPLEVVTARELPPFEAAVAAGARTVMSSHIVVPALDPDAPATFSRAVLDDLLRSRLGFAGVVVSDALDMAGASGAIGIPAAAVRAIDGGCDLLCIGTRNTDAQLAAIQAALVDAVAAGALDADRLAGAAARVAALGSALAATVPSAEAADDDFPIDPAVVAAAFDVREGVVAPVDAIVVVAEPRPNVAIGHSVWGPASAGADVVVVRDGDPLPAGDGPIVLVGRDVHLHPWVRELAAAARERHPGSVVVDMGWPSPGREDADVATFGASLPPTRALLAWLGRSA